jgi:predicted nucleotidyltransferase
MEILINNKKDKVLEFFLLHPTKETHLRELSRTINISLPWVRKQVTELSKEDLVSQKKQHSVILVEANRDSLIFQGVKRSYNILSLYKSGIIEYLKEVYHHPEAIVLFGSYSKGEDIETSDIDIAILTSRSVKHNLKKYEKKLQRKIHILELEKKKIEEEFWSTLANGIVLEGYLQVR